MKVGNLLKDVVGLKFKGVQMIKQIKGHSESGVKVSQK